MWSTIGALAQVTSTMNVTTAVTCPTVRIHPAVIAQAAATSAVLLEGRFALGLGSGEALNEHILGDHWPQADQRLEMLEETVQVIRTLWQGGMQSHRGRHYQVENARIYDLPERTPSIPLSGFGPKATKLAAKISDGYCTVQPDKQEVQRFREAAAGPRPVAGGMKVCWASEEVQARATAYRLWPNEQLPGELAQILPTPAHFEQASELINEDMVAEAVPCGPDLDLHLQAIKLYARARGSRAFLKRRGSCSRARRRSLSRMISRAGVRDEAHRVRSILQATMEAQQLNGGK